MRNHPGAFLAVSVLLTLSFFSCIQKRYSDSKQLLEALENSNKVVSLGTQTILKELENKTTDPVTSERAGYWYPRAAKVAILSTNFYNYIDSIKRLQEPAKELPENLRSYIAFYKKELLNIDSAILLQFRDYRDFTMLDSARNSLEGLAAIQTNIRIIENKLVNYCSNKIGSTDGWSFFDYYSAIVGQNSNVFKPGDKLEIKAGIGAFSKAAVPKIIIGGKKVELGEEGFALYKVKVSTSPGQYSIPLRISYFNQMIGKEESFETTIAYSVVKPCDQ